MPSEYRPVRIADMGAALRLLSEVYPDARRALAEFIANAADAFILGDREKLKRNWHCDVHLGPKEIFIDDNGPGITRDRLLELPSRVTLSAKRGDLQQKGHKAIGLLAFSSFCEDMRIISRPEGEADTFEAHWTTDSLTSPDENPVRIDLAREIDALKAPGTRVVLSRLFDDRIHQLKAVRMVEFLRNEFSPDLRAKRYDLIIHEGKNKYPVLPGRYTGVLFPKLILKTSKGEKIELELYLTQKPMMQRVALFVRGKQTLTNLGEVPDFSEGPWKSGRVAGEVRCDFLRPTTGRAAIEHGEEWKRFSNCLKEIEGEIQVELERIAEEQRTREATRLFKEINQALASVLPHLRWDELPKSAKGDMATGFPPGKDGVGPSGGNGKALNKDRGSSPISPRRARLIDPSRPRKMAGSAATGFNYRETEFEPEQQSLRSRYVGEQSLIEVNCQHVDYVTERDRERHFKDYLMRIVVKEIALLNFKNMGEHEVAERIVELETALHRSLG